MYFDDWYETYRVVMSGLKNISSIQVFFQKKVGTFKVYANYPMLSNSWHCNFIGISKFHVKNTIFNEKQITEKQQQLLMFNKLKKKMI